ncbi:alpha/beta hydrolase-fold protein [Pseudomonas akapageensis]|uniref:alpha/beta hydrolase-fold protein n=1 Tax=Pseudomonas akapageensis TaxID=2609961 RepID=UPI001407BEB5|nr:alpha/beta hydrolase-fold protein [Pseudomonas akapageensis]
MPPPTPRRLLTPLLIGLIASLSSACNSIPAPQARRQQAIELAQQHHWQAQTLTTSTFQLQAFTPAPVAWDRHLTVYLEGDGFAWISSSQPSSDPTPINPLALRLALAQPVGRAVYLARPCQYFAAQSSCSQRYWTDARFAEEVVASLDQAIDELKSRAGAQQLTLVGYSGGAALALLLAARRHDVQDVISVSGNLDHAAWTRLHRVQPLRNSLNPVDLQAALMRIKQVHLVGALDQNTPPELAKRFIATYPPTSPSEVRILPGYDHQCCWAQNWPALWRQTQETATEGK